MKKKNFFGIFDHDEETVDTEIADEESMLLRKEELDIAKDRIGTGEVTLHKDIVEEHKSVDVPVTHEEVVIERRAFDHQQSNSPIGEEETIHIPVSEERVEVGKHTEITGEISAHKREVEEMKHIDEILKREEAQVEVDGDRNRIISKEREDR